MTAAVLLAPYQAITMFFCVMAHGAIYFCHIQSPQDDELQFDADGMPIDVPDAEQRRPAALGRPPRTRSCSGAGGTSGQQPSSGGGPGSSIQGGVRGDENRELRSRLQAVEAVRGGVGAGGPHFKLSWVLRHPAAPVRSARAFLLLLCDQSRNMC